MDPIIPKEKAQGVQTWDAPDFGRTVKTPQRLPTAQDIEAMFDRARAEGFEEGRRVGLATGEREGRVAGHAAGLEAGRAQAAGDVAALRAMLERLREPVDRLDADLENAVVALALEVARQVLIAELQTRPEALLPVLHKALAAFPAHSGAPWARLHPDDVDMLRAVAPEIENGGLSLVADPSLQRGDLVLAAGGEPPRAVPERRWRTRGAHDAPAELDLRLEERWRQVMARLFEEGSL